MAPQPPPVPAAELHPLRSVLYVPGSNARALAKAPTLPADAFILDLEDAVLPEAKLVARRAVCDALASGAFAGRCATVRVNALGTPWGAAELEAVAQAGASAIVLPKVESPDDVAAVEAALVRHGAPAGLPLWLMVETPRAVLDLERVAAASQRVRALVVGSEDLSRALRLGVDAARRGLAFTLGRVVLVARALGLEALDGVATDLADLAAFKASCAEGRALGFDGKTLLHPGQVPLANEVFGVSAAQAVAAAELIEAWESARAQGSGVAVYRGRLVEALHVEQARRELALHGATERAAAAPAVSPDGRG